MASEASIASLYGLPERPDRDPGPWQIRYPMVPDASGTLESKAVVDSGSGELNAEKTNDIGRSVSEDVEDVVSDDLFDDLEIRRWVRIAADAADDKLGQRTEAFFVGEIMAITDWFIITSGSRLTLSF